MFNSLTGIITNKMPQAIFLQLGGVEWDLMVPDTALDILPPIGNEATLYTWLYHKEDSMRMFAFSSTTERSVFLDLMKVDGVGPKAAIKILSSITANELVDTLNSDDMARLETISGIGKKTAQKMMLALKGKLHLEDGAISKSTSSRLVQTSPWEDVIMALVNMGYEKKQCEQVISKLLDELKEDEDFTSKNRTGQEEFLFRRAIVDLV